MNTTFETAILNMLAPLQPVDQLKILASVKKGILNAQPIEQMASYNSLKDKLDIAIKQIFSLVDENDVYLNLDEVHAHLLGSSFQKEYVKMYLNSNGIKVGAVCRKLIPRIVNGEISWIKQNGRFYTFSRSGIQ